MSENQDPVLITGVGRRLGFRLASTLSGRGIKVIGTYRTERPELEILEENGTDLIKSDFAQDREIQSLIREVKTRYPSLRALIHNASDWLAESKALDAATTIKRMIQVHVSAPYQINLGLASCLEQTRDSCADIIHIGDYVSSRGSGKHIAYAASKAAQDNLTLSFAARLAPRVKVNSLAPALVLFNADDDEEYRRKALDKSLMQREAGLDEFQHAVDYLLQSHYVTGRVLPIDGGRHLR